MSEFSETIICALFGVCAYKLSTIWVGNDVISTFIGVAFAILMLLLTEYVLRRDATPSKSDKEGK